MIPAYDESGNLPPGIHEADWHELEAAFGGSPHRATLLAGLREALLFDLAAPRAAQKERFGGELFPASFVADPESGAQFLDFFQRDRDGEPKGIIQIDLEGLA